MDAILPFKIKNEQKFFESASKVGYNEMEIIKFIYIVQQSDLDIFPKMNDERINILLYGWELCEDYKQKLDPNEWELPEEMEMVLKILVPWTMDIWFSKEWDKCKYLLKAALLHCLNRARDLLMRMPDMMQINWDFLLLYNLKPWNVLYLKNLTVTKEKTIETGAQSIETEELPATDEDVSYVKLEQLPIIVLRLIKIFDQSSIDMVKTLCMRVITAWNKIHQSELETSGSRRPYIPPEDKRCLMLICHIYLMAVYEADDVKGYIIDNMINNIRFYYQGYQNSSHTMDNLEYTPARYIALTNIHLRVQKRDFFDFFIWNKYDTTLVNLFGVVSQAYKSYLLGNLLMELNNMNEDDFVANIPLYKRLMNSYVNEREKSELFLLNELTKIEAQRYAHNIIQTVKNVSDFKSKICKGNRMSNIGNYENSDDTVAPLAETKIENNSEVKEVEIKEEIAGEYIEDEQERVRIKESELRLDPVFQFLPNNENILYYVYDVLAKKDYTGWHFAKIVVLVKIIGLEQNMIETWRYHPGLTTDFMLSLEVKLSDHYVDLAKIFKDQPFLEQEFWLTAFYLNPTSELYEVIKRLGMRNNRKRTDEQTKLVMSSDRIEAKYGLLSSTIDVKELASMSNNDDPIRDYDPLFSVLHSLRVPDSLVKDMLTAIFLPRNRSFAWAIDWVVLRNRCKMIMTSSKEKKRFVDLNMAEANDRLKYLVIDYEKYKNRPQLDYGTIEEGYENLISSTEFDKESEDEEDEEEDFEDDEDVYESKRKGRRSINAARKKEEDKADDDNSQEDDPFLMGKRRTRARTAATLASFLFQTLPRTSRRRKNQKPEEETKAGDEKTSAEADDKSSGSKSPVMASESAISSPTTADFDRNDAQFCNRHTKNLKECLKDRPTFLNTTHGFKNLIDIWNVEKSDLQSVDENCVALMESSTALQIAVKLKLLNKEINPICADEKEYIDDKEMIIHNSEYFVKKEFDVEMPNDVEEMKIVSRDIGDNEKIEQSEVSNDVKASMEYVIDKVFEGVPKINSEEINELHTAVSAKSNIFNIGSEIENKMIQFDGSTERNLIGRLKDQQEILCMEKCGVLEQRNVVEEENNVMEYSLVEQLSVNTENKSIEEQRDNELENRRVQTDKSANNSANSHDKMTNELNEIINEHESKEIDKHQNTDMEIAEIAKEVDNGKKNSEFERRTDAYCHSKISEEAERQKLQNYDIRNLNTLSEEPKHIDNEKGNEEVIKNQLERDFDNTCQQVTADQILQEVFQAIQDKIAEDLGQSRSVNKVSNDTSKGYEGSFLENISAKELVHEQSNTLEELKNEEKPNSSKHISKNRVVESLQEIPDKSASKTKKCFHNKDNDTQNSTENIKNKINSKANEEIKTNLRALDNFSGQIPAPKELSETTDIFIRKEFDGIPHTQHKKHELCSTKLKVSDDKDSSIMEHYLLCGELSKNGGKTDKACKNKLETSDCVRGVDLSTYVDELADADCEKNCRECKAATTDCRNGTVKTTNLENLAAADVNKRRTATVSYIEKFETNDYLQGIEPIAKGRLPATFNIETLEATSCGELLATTDFDSLENIDFEKVIDSITDQGVKETRYCKNVGSASSDQTTYIEITPQIPNFLSSHDTKTDSIQSSDDDEQNSEAETAHLKKLCLTRDIKILLHKLQPTDLINLRQPKVRIQRMSYEKYVGRFRAKRRCIESRVYLDFEDSSNSFATNTSSSESYHPTRVKRKKPVQRQPVRPVRSSDSDNDTNNSDDYKLSTILANSRKRRLSTPPTSHSSTSRHMTGPKSARKTNKKPARRTTGPKSSKHNLVVTPRSASGLKLRISNAEQNLQDTSSRSKRFTAPVYDEIIQLSSSSDECVLDDLSTLEEVIEIEDYPLFEEEIII